MIDEGGSSGASLFLVSFLPRASFVGQEAAGVAGSVS